MFKPRTLTSALVVAVLVFALAFLAPGQARASHLNSGLVVSLGTPVVLVSGVYLEVPIDVTCPVLPLPDTAIFSDDVSVRVTENTGRVTTGFGDISFQSPAFNGIGFGTPLSCDGGSHTYTVDVFPSGSSPFHGGRAVGTGSVNLSVYDPTNPCVFCTADQNFAQAVPTSINIRG